MYVRFGKLKAYYVLPFLVLVSGDGVLSDVVRICGVHVIVDHGCGASGGHGGVSGGYGCVGASGYGEYDCAG